MSEANAAPRAPQDRTPDLQAMVEQVVKMLVSAPDQVRVESEDEDGTIYLNLHVADADLGKVIGKSGRMAKALRAIVNAAADKQGKRYSLEIIEDDRDDDDSNDSDSANSSPANSSPGNSTSSNSSPANSSPANSTSSNSSPANSTSSNSSPANSTSSNSSPGNSSPANSSVDDSSDDEPNFNRA